MKKLAKKIVNKTAPILVEDHRRIVNLENKLNEVLYKLDDGDFKISKLKNQIKAVEQYQPVYAINGIVNNPQRYSNDRCKTIENNLGRVGGLKILDVGSSLGYLCYYFADRGSLTEGWEYNPKNAEVSRLIGEINGISTHIKTKAFDLESVNDIKSGDYDVITILSVIHHIIFYKGLKYTQELMKETLEKVPIVIVELATKNEDRNIEWNDSQPKNELEIFDLVKDRVKIRKIGEFSNHLSDKKRPLYAVMLKNTIKVNEKSYKYIDRKNEAYSNSPLTQSRSRRFYYFGDNYVIKEYELNSNEDTNNIKQIISELNVFTNYGSSIDHPKLIDFELTSNKAKLVIEKIDGKLLNHCISDDDKINKETIIKDVLKTLSNLEKVGLHHNDVRSWNIIYDGKKATLIDFGLVSHKNNDNDLIALLWSINSIAERKRESYEMAKKTLPNKANFNQGIAKKFYEIVENGESSATKALEKLV